MKKLLILLQLYLLQFNLIMMEIVEVPKLALYHVTPESDIQLKYLNKLRASDSGMIFINGIGTRGETIEILAAPDVMEHHDRELDELKLLYSMQFNPVTIEMFNNETKRKSATYPEQFPDMPMNKELMEIVKISPPVYSGIFLQISHPEHKQLGLLTLSMQANSSMGNQYLCLSTEKPGKETASGATKQWIFEETEMDGHFALRNRKYTGGYVTWDDDDEQLLVLDTRMEMQSKYRKDGVFRQNVLFKVKRTWGRRDLGPLFELAILGEDKEEKNIMLDTKWEKSTGCMLLRRTPKATEKDMNFAFKIQRAMGSVKVVGHLERFKYLDSISDLFEKAQSQGTVKPLTTRQVFNHANEPLKMEIEDIHERLDKFNLKFKDTMVAFHELYVPPGLSIGTTTSSKDERVKKGIHASVKLNKHFEKDTVAKIKYLVAGGIQVPAWSSVSYAIVFGWLEKLNLGFDATLRITGRADRMSKGRRPKVVMDQPVNVLLAKDILMERGFSMEMKENSNANDSTSPPPMSHEMTVSGSVFAWSLGIKGEIEMSVNSLSKNVNTTCHDEE